MKRTFTFFLIIFVNIIALYSQTEQKFGIQWGGFLKTDAFYDTRQYSGLREGHFLLYPLKESLDKNGVDINEKGSFNILSIQSRLFGKITAPEAFGAKSYGYIEGEFFGTSDGDVNGFRMRHAYIVCDWGSTELLVGQTWHPMFITTNFPDVISFNTGAPFQLFSRNPQIRLRQNIFGGLRIYLTAFSQRDMTGTGPSGFSSIYLRNSGIPELNAKLEYQFKSDNDEILLGVSGGYKTIIPRTKNGNNEDAYGEKVSTISGSGYLKLKFNALQIKLQSAITQNGVDMLQIGGYAVKSSNNGVWEYTPWNISSSWLELIYTAKLDDANSMDFALFGGYSMNLGTQDELTYKDNNAFVYYGRNPDIANLMRISPRIIFNSGKTRFALETEYTSAAYGTLKSDGTVENTKNYANLRYLLGVYIFF